MGGAALTLVCHDCGEVYQTADAVAAIAANQGYCVNLTCLADLSDAVFFESVDRR